MSPSADAGTWSLEAPAKVNLRLRVLHRRPDGYRELDTLFQSLELADTVRVSVRGRSSRRGSCSPVSLRVDGPDLGPERENLAVRAAEAFAEAFGLPGAVHIELLKRIPAGAGLGGGSSDAAAVLRLLARIAAGAGRAEESPGARGAVDPAALHAIAASLGSDVPFFLQPSPLAVGRGRGEVLDPIPALPAMPVVVALPPIHVATAWAYRALGEAREARLAPAGGRGAVDDDGLEGGLPPATSPRSWDDVIAGLSNDFEEVVPAAYTEVGASLAGLREAGARGVLLSGSGGACFGLFDEEETAVHAAADLSNRLGWPFVATRTRVGVPSPVSG